VVIDHGNGEFSVIAHLQPHSLKVRLGQRVKTGQALGKVGNSGNTSEPHVHYHLQNAVDMRDADGLPAQFENLIIDGSRIERAEILRGQRVRPQ
jgi:murein DD-endopeptidase MepM/ murein hydrolase activator NlpD